MSKTPDNNTTEDNRVHLTARESSSFIRVMQIIFGIICLVTAAWWTLFMFKAEGIEHNYWIAIMFMFGFGAFQLFSGLGYGLRYIEYSGEYLTIKRYVIAKEITLTPGDIEKIVIRNLSVIIVLKGRRNIKIRFGVTYTTIMESTKELFIEYAASNNILLETTE